MTAREIIGGTPGGSAAIEAPKAKADSADAGRSPARPQAVQPRELGPTCRCGRRGTVRVGYSEDPSLNSDTTALLRRCPHCGQTYLYRLHEGVLLPFNPITALSLDERRADWARSA